MSNFLRPASFSMARPGQAAGLGPWHRWCRHPCGPRPPANRGARLLGRLADL